MSQSWTISLPCTRAVAQAVSDAQDPLGDIVDPPVLVASEVDDDADAWRIDAYFDGPPDTAARRAIAALIGCPEEAMPPAVPIADQDWVTVSQAGLDPVRAGRFFVHTGVDDPDDAPDVISFRIDAGQAFGTGHHATTAGCLAALDRLARQGRMYHAIVDIGTGTGLLAFAALHLWPRARASASDIDPISVRVTVENAAENGVPLGEGAGQLWLAQADGTRHPMIAARAPYDLICANILAGPLIALAPAIAAIAVPGATLLVAGLLERQRGDVVRAYRRSGFRLDHPGDGEWPVLQMTRRVRYGHRRAIRANGSAGQPPGDFGAV